MKPSYYLDLTIKYGVVPLMFFWILTLDAKLEKVEARLYDCYEDQINIRGERIPKDKIRLVAILPDKTKLTNHDKDE